MSIDSSVKEEKLGVQIQVSSKKIQMLLEKGISPSEILSDVIENLSEEQINEISKGSKNVFEQKISDGPTINEISVNSHKKTGVRCPECNIMTNEKNYSHSLLEIGQREVRFLFRVQNQRNCFQISLSLLN